MPLSRSEAASVLIIVGMHRSGTSLIASLLQSAGLFVGERLLPPTENNVKGHFENLDFYHLHRAMLRSQGASEDGWTLQEHIDVDDIHLAEAKKVVAQNAISSPWGWKDPRTVLFLDFWADLLPNANFLMVYRSPWDVADSLYRRGDSIFQQQPHLAIKIWLHYNKKIINFCNHYPNRSLLTDIQTAIRHSVALLQTINQRFSLTLAVPILNPYDSTLMHHVDEDSHRLNLINYYFSEAIELYQTLEAAAWHPDEPIDASWRERLTPNFYKIWAFQDWANTCHLKQQNHILQATVEDTRAQLQQVENTLESTQAQLQQTQAELAHTKATLKQLQPQLPPVPSPQQDVQT